MDYIAPHVDINTPNIAQDNLTPDLTRICPVCFEEWTGKGAQIIYHILQKHAEHLIKPEDNYQGDVDQEVVDEYNDYTFTLLDNSDNSDDEIMMTMAKSIEGTDEIVKIFIEYEKVFVVVLKRFPAENANKGFNVSVHYIGPYLNKAVTMKFTCMLHFGLNNRKCLSSISDTVGETADFVVEEDMTYHLQNSLSQWPVVIKIQISVPKKFQQLIDAIKSRLTCFRCKVMMQPAIRHCRYGHIICKNCRQKILTRPVCPSCYYNSLEFHKTSDLSHEIHPGMRQYQTKQSHYVALGNLGIGDVNRSDNVEEVKIALGEEVADFGVSKIGNLRLLEEEALQVAYCCDGGNCQVWIGCLDLEEHKKEYH